MRTGASNAARNALFALVGLLFFVWPMPHTISLRQSLLGVTLLLAAYLAYRARPRLKELKPLATPLVVLAVMILWMHVVAVFLAIDTASALHDIRGQWLTSVLIMLMGAAVAMASRGEGWATRGALLSIFAAFMLHVLYLDLDALVRLFTEGALPRAEGGLTSGRDKISYISIFAVTFCLADGYMRASGKKRFLPVSAPVLAALFIATLFSLYLGGARNAVALTLVLFIAAAALFIYENGLDKKKALLLFASTVAVAVMGYVSVTKTPQWRTLMDTIPLALDIEKNKCWLDCEKYPLDMDMTYTHSNYMRIAWFKAGLIIIGENPLGRGFEKNAYGHAIKAKYGEGGGKGHSHSGIIDFGIGNGIPGIIILYAFYFSLIHAALRAFKHNASFSALLMAFLIFGLALRTVSDSMLRDHMLQQYMFLIGFLGVLMIRRKAADEAPREP